MNKETEFALMFALSSILLGIMGVMSLSFSSMDREMNSVSNFSIYIICVLLLAVIFFTWFTSLIQMDYNKGSLEESKKLISRQNEIIENILKKISNDQATNDQKSTKE